MQPRTNLRAWWLGVLQLTTFSTPTSHLTNKNKIKSIELLFLIILGHYVVQSFVASMCACFGVDV
jgi:hypothetical protein